MTPAAEPADAPLEAEAPVRAYRDAHELVLALEDELLVRWRAARQLEQSDASEPALVLRARALERTRNRRLAATPDSVGFARLVRELRLGPTETTLVAWLLLLRESFRLKETVRDRESLRLEWETAAAALTVATLDRSGWLRERRLLAAQAPLVRSGFVELSSRGGVGFASVELALSGHAAGALLDDEAAMSHERGGVELDWPVDALDALVLPPHHLEVLERTVRELQAPRASSAGRGTVLLFRGPPGTGKTAAARALAGTAGVPLVVITPFRCQEAEEALGVALTEARRLGAPIFFDEFDKVVDPDGGPPARALLKLLEDATTPVILATNNPQLHWPALARRDHEELAFPFPEEEDRKRLWRRMLPPNVALTDQQVEALATDYWLSGAHIRNAVELASRGGDGRDFGQALRQAAQTQAQRLEEAFGSSVRLLRTWEVDLAQRAVPADLAPALASVVRQQATRTHGARRPQVVGLHAADEAVLVELCRQVAWLSGQRLFRMGPGRPPRNRGTHYDEVSAALAELLAGLERRYVALVLVAGSVDLVAGRLDEWRELVEPTASLVVLASTSEAIFRSVVSPSASLSFELHGPDRREVMSPLERYATDVAVLLSPEAASVDFPPDLPRRALLQALELAAALSPPGPVTRESLERALALVQATTRGARLFGAP